jgi:hypothetical protein
MSKNSPVAVSAQMVYVADPVQAEQVTGKAPENDRTKEEEKGNKEVGGAEVQAASKPPTKATPTPPVPVDVVSATATVKLPSLDPTWTKRIEAVKTSLKTRNLKPEAVLEPFGSGVLTNTEIIPKAFAKVEMFSFDGNVVKDDPMLGYTIAHAIPMHIIGLDAMVSGKTTRTEFHKKLADEWKGVIDFVSVMTTHNSSFSNCVLGVILKHHVAETASMYCILVHCSESTGLCKTRAKILLEWVRSLKEDAEDYWKLHSKDLIIQALRGAILRIKQKKPKDAEKTQDAIDDEYDGE